jgi:hypothetical protein
MPATCAKALLSERARLNVSFGRSKNMQEITTIGLDIAKPVFRFTASTQMARWSAAVS